MADPWAAAEANVAVKYDPQQAALQRQLDLARSHTQQGEQSLNEYGTSGRGIINDTYNTLYGLLGQNRTQQAADLGKQVGNVNAGYDTAVQQIQGWQNQSRDYLNQMAQQLGQQGAGLRNSTELENLVNTNLGRANFAKANYGGNLQEWAAKMDSLLGMGIDSAHQAGAQRLSNFEAELMQALGQNKLAGTEQETELQAKLADILGLRQTDLVNMYNQLAAEQWDRDFKQAQLDQQAAEHAAEMSYKYSALDAASGGGSGGSSGYDAMDWAKLGMSMLKEQTANAQWREEMDWEKSKGAGGDTDWGKFVNPYMEAGAFGRPDSIDEFGNPVQGNFDFGALSDFIQNGPMAIQRSQERAAQEKAESDMAQFNRQISAYDAQHPRSSGGGGGGGGGGLAGLGPWSQIATWNVSPAFNLAYNLWNR